MASNLILVMAILKILKILSLLGKMEIPTQMTKLQMMETAKKKSRHLNLSRFNLKLVTQLSSAKMSTKTYLLSLAHLSQLSSLSENSKTIKSY